MSKTMNNPNINPYKTSYGKMIKISDVEKLLTKYINGMAGIEIEKLGYQVNFFGITPILITGKNDKERSLPPFNYPIYMRDYNGRECIIINLTDYLNPRRVKEVLENKVECTYEDLASCANNIPSMECLLAVGKVMAARLTGDDYNLDLLWKQFGSVYGTILVSLFNSSISRLSIIEEMNVRSVALVYYYLKLKGLENVKTEQLMAVLDEDNTRNLLRDTDMISSLQINGQPLCNRMLAEIIREVIDPAKAHITLDTSLFNNIKGEWFGLKGSGIISMMMECDSFFIPIVYYGLSDKSFSKTRISITLSKGVSKQNANKIVDGLASFFKPKN